MATQEYAGPTNMGAGRKTPPTQRPSKGGKNKDKEGKDDQAGDGKDGTAQNEAQGHARFTTKRTTTSRRRRTSPNRISLAEDCDYLAYYCLKAYDTGKVCARTIYDVPLTFENYCMVDYVNCMERYDIWIIKHMGECFILNVLTEHRETDYQDESFLDNYFIVEDV